jgi:hypothetical protein
VLAGCLLLVACGGGATPEAETADDVVHETRTRPTSQSDPFSDVRVSPDAEALQVDCDFNAFENCNGLDDDCNGIIDDQCGYESGEVQVTVSWNSGADIDLYVTDPSGATLFYNEKHKRSKIGGHLDHDARGDCRKEQQNSRIENAYWPSPAKPGAYRVELQYFSPCGAGATSTDATLTAVVDNVLVGSYRIRLEPEQRVQAVQFVKR